MLHGGCVFRGARRSDRRPFLLDGGRRTCRRRLSRRHMVLTGRVLDGMRRRGRRTLLRGGDGSPSGCALFLGRTLLPRGALLHWGSLLGGSTFLYGSALDRTGGGRRHVRRLTPRARVALASCRTTRAVRSARGADAGGMPLAFRCLGERGRKWRESERRHHRAGEKNIPDTGHGLALRKRIRRP